VLQSTTAIAAAGLQNLFPTSTAATKSRQLFLTKNTLGFSIKTKVQKQNLKRKTLRNNSKKKSREQFHQQQKHTVQQTKEGMKEGRKEEKKRNQSQPTGL
jgi:hypothetical protein